MTSGPARKGAAIFGRTVSGQGQGKHRLPFLTVLTLRGMLWTLALSSTGPWRWVWRPAQARGTHLVPEELGLPAGQRTRVGRCLGPLTLLCSLPEPSGKLLFLSSPTWHEAVPCMSHIPAGAPCALCECALAQSTHTHTPAHPSYVHTPPHTHPCLRLASRPAVYTRGNHTAYPPSPSPLASSGLCPPTTWPLHPSWALGTHAIVGTRSLPSHNSSGPSMKREGGLRIRDGPGLPMALPALPLKGPPAPGLGHRHRTAQASDHTQTKPPRLKVIVGKLGCPFLTSPSPSLGG